MMNLEKTCFDYKISNENCERSTVIDNTQESYEEEDDEVENDLIYLNADGEKSYEDLSALEPLVEYVYEDDSKSPQLKFGDGFQEYVAQDYVETEILKEGMIPQNNINEDDNGSVGRSDSLLHSDMNQYRIEPMMPFFLTSPVVTIVNENNEIGETIILQIENETIEERKEKKEPKKPIRIDMTPSILQSSLCSSKDNSIINTYTCEVCNMSYGCLNCLKSHYETMHIANTYVTQYKCKYSVEISKQLYCPVCELTFDNRSDTMDHYITHSVACDICGSGFDRPQYLTEHLKSAHNKGDFTALYDCELCKTVYQYGANLRKHYQAFHKMILCIICKVKFEDANDLQEHEKEHWQKFNVLPFACSKCDKAFANISDIPVHIRQDHNHNRKVVNRPSSVNVQKKVSDDEQKPNKRVKAKK